MVHLQDINIKCCKSPSSIPILLTVEFVKSEIDANIEWSPTTVLELKPDTGAGLSFSTVSSICRFIARVASPNKLYGNTILEKTEIDHWIEFANSSLCPGEFKVSVGKLNRLLSSVTYLVGHDVTLADITVWGALYGNKQWHHLVEEGQQPQNILRWFNFLLSLEKFATVSNLFPFESKNACASVTNSNKESKHITQDKGKFVDLPGAEIGQVVVRFPPEASGFLHVGHAKAALLNQHYQINFKGKLIFRFDDTNPEKEKEDFEKVILEDVALLQIKPDIFSYTSDHFDFILEKCDELLKRGLAYVDDTDPEIMKKEREQRLESRNRGNDIAKNFAMWELMKKGTEYGQQCCVRAKINMNSDNGCLRDPTLYRCKNTLHPKTADKFKVYPTYDFACPIVDSIEGVTHALRTTEYHDRDDQFFWILEMLSLRKPYIYEYSRLNMMNTVLSKRKLTWFVDQGIVEGWDDPRMPTVRGVLRRGMTVEGLKQFIVAQGSSRSVVVMEWDKIWAFNKKVIDGIAPRYSAVEKYKAVPVFVEGAKQESFETLKHPKNPSLGNKTVMVGPKLLVDYVDAEVMKKGENVTFINWGNLFINEINKNFSGEIESIHAKLNLDNKDYKKTLKVTWVADSENTSLVPCTCIYYDHLISKPILGKDEDFKNYLSENTKIEVIMLGDSEMACLKKGDIIQIQRKGFFICDESYDSSSNRYTSREMPLILISIPDGSKDTSTLPKTVQVARSKVESSKELLNRVKGKIAEKSPQEEQKNIIDTIAELDKQIKIQGDKVRSIKQEKITGDVDGEVKALLHLKSLFKEISGRDWKPENQINVQSNKDISESNISKPQETPTEVDRQIRMQGDKIRKLKSEKVEKSILEPEIKLLLHLKKMYKDMTGEEWKPENQVHLSKPKRQTSLQSSKDASESNSESFQGTPLEIDTQIRMQGDKIRKLKSEKAGKNILDPEIKHLLHLKKVYKDMVGKDWEPDNQAHISKHEGKKEFSESQARVSELNACIEQQGNKIRKMKTDKAAKDALAPEIKVLLDLKSEYKTVTGKEWHPSSDGTTFKEGKINSKQCSKDVVTDKPNAEKASNQYNETLKPNLQVHNKKENVLSTETSKTQTNKTSCTEGLSKDGIKYEKKKKNEKKVKDAVSVNNEDVSDLGIKKVTRLGLEAKKEENLSDWYSQVITKAEMIEYYDVSGCYILRPWAYNIWEAITKFFDPAIKMLGVNNCYFPMFVSSNALEKEKSHITDFAPEVAWVTKSGGTDLAEPIAIRPTSETVMYPSYAKWIKSHRDLPLQLNQWCSVVRWEFKHPQPFLRTREFLWQEGHTAFATQEEAVEEVYTILDLYADIYEKLLAVPVIRGKKTEKEKFAGADFTTTVEAYISANGRAIQGATSHFLGQNFSKMFEIIFEDPETSEKRFVYQNSWGLSTRTIGVMIMVHADNTGLVLPPEVASYQVVIVPCGITANLAEKDKQELIEKCKDFEKKLHSADIRVKGDYRVNYSPGWKFNHWELKGVPLRIELGPRDIKNQQFVAVRRDTGEKCTMKTAEAPNCVKELLASIQKHLFMKAKSELDEHLSISHEWNDFCNKLENRYVIQAPFCGVIACEDKIKQDSAKDADQQLEPGAPSMGAKSLCIPFIQPGTITPDMRCIHPICENKPKYYTLFGRSY